MAAAIICDRCGTVFASNVRENQANKWQTVWTEDGRVNYAVYDAKEGGRVQDVCQPCVAKILTTKEVKEN